MSLSDTHHFRKLVAGACMVLAPILLLVAAVIHPGFETDEAAQLGVIAESRDAWYIATLLGLVSIALAVPAVLGLMHMLREREAAAGHLGGGLALLGLLAFAALAGMAFVAWQMAATGADQAQMAALLENVRESSGVFFPVYLITYAFALGMLVLAYGLGRARAVPAVMAVCLAIGGVAVVLAAPLGAAWLMIVGAAFLVVGLGSTGLMVLRATDADWENTPHFRGFRPAGGSGAAA
jgi:hypothetical protein